MPVSELQDMYQNALWNVLPNRSGGWCLQQIKGNLTDMWMTSASADNAYQRMRTRVKPNGGSTCMLYSISGTTCSILIFYFVFKLSRGENGECFCHYQFHFHSVFCSIFQSSTPSSNTTMSLPIVYYSPIVCHSYCPSFTM